MSLKARKNLFRIGTLVVAGTLLYLSLRGADLDGLKTDLLRGHYIWALPLFAVTLGSHLLRAIRWRFLLHALPERSSQARAISVRGAFSSLMIGYMVNYVAPRFGEVVRTSHLSIREKLSFSGVFGTVVAERLLDVLTLGVCLLSVPVVLGDRTWALVSVVSHPVSALLDENLTEFVVVAVLGLFVLATGVVLLFRHAGSGRPISRFSAALEAFRTGLLTLGRSGHSASIFVFTALIWMCYGLMAFIPLLIFDMTGSGGVTLAGAWALMLIGSIGMALPSPGGVGSYHFLTIQALVLVWGVPQETAASYAIFTHGGQLILYAVTGFAVILLEGANFTDLKSASLQDAATAGIIDPSK